MRADGSQLSVTSDGSSFGAGLDDTTVEEFEDLVFELLDPDDNGIVSLDEFGSFVAAMHAHPNFKPRCEVRKSVVPAPLTGQAGTPTSSAAPSRRSTTATGLYTQLAD